VACVCACLCDGARETSKKEHASMYLSLHIKGLFLMSLNLKGGGSRVLGLTRKQTCRQYRALLATASSAMRTANLMPNWWRTPFPLPRWCELSLFKDAAPNVGHDTLPSLGMVLGRSWKALTIVGKAMAMRHASKATGTAEDMSRVAVRSKLFWAGGDQLMLFRTDVDRTLANRSAMLDKSS